MDNNTEFNELIYAGVKLITDKVGITLRKPTRNARAGC